MSYKSLSGIYGFLTTGERILSTYLCIKCASNCIPRGVKTVGSIMIEVLNEDVGFNFRIWMSQIYYAI